MNQKQDKKPAFNSNVARIIGSHISSANPGPGSYMPTPFNFNLKPIKRQKKIMMNQSFDWIVNQSRIKSLESHQNNKHVGPNTYDVQVVSKAHKYSWSKVQRFAQKHDKKSEIGPGYYNYEQRKDVSGAGAVFRSKVPKHIDVTSSQTALPAHKLALLQLQKAIQQKMGPQKLEQVKFKPQKPEKSSFFASKVPRFQFKNQSPTKDIGPGAYTLQSDEIKLKRSSPKLVEAQRPQRSKSPKDIELGPGSYDLSNFSLSRQLQKKGYPLSKETRFNFNNKKAHSTILPGPGQYMQKKYIYADKQKLLKEYDSSKSKRRAVSHAIIDNRPQQRTPSRQKSPQFYDVKVFDMSYQLQKKKWYYQNLKELKVQLAPFNSKALRLP